MISISHHQLRAARSLVDLDQKVVSQATGISANAISRIERGEVSPQEKTKQKLMNFYEEAGVEFTEGNGVREQRTYVQRYFGTDGLRTFLDEVYMEAKETGGDFVIFNGMPSKLLKYSGEEWYEKHTQRMIKLSKNYNFRVIVEHGESNLIGKDFVTYRWFPKDEFHEHMIYVYGDHVAFSNFNKNISILVVREKEMADSHRTLFNHVWDYAKDVPAHVHQLQAGD